MFGEVRFSMWLVKKKDKIIAFYIFFSSLPELILLVFYSTLENKVLIFKCDLDISTQLNVPMVTKMPHVVKNALSTLKIQMGSTLPSCDLRGEALLF